MVNRCRPFIFAIAPSPLTAIAVREALLLLREELEHQQVRANLVMPLHVGEITVLCVLPSSPSNLLTIPYTGGDDARAMRIASALRARQWFWASRGWDSECSAVPAGTTRLRIS